MNGVSITQIETVADVAYFHIELDTHDVILAEGAPSETFIDDNSRGMFFNAAEYHNRYPHAAASPAWYCAPRIEDGPALTAVRQRLAERFARKAAPTTPPHHGNLLGGIHAIDSRRMVGWARDEEAPDVPVVLRIRDNGALLGEVTANRGPDRNGFALDIQGGLAPDRRHVIQVQRACDDRGLPDGVAGRAHRPHWTRRASVVPRTCRYRHTPTDHGMGAE